MADVHAHADEGSTTRGSQPLIRVVTQPEGEEVVRYFTSEEDVDRGLSSDPAGIQEALSLAGAWEHLDAEDGPDILDELDRLRHESKPTPPLRL